MFKLTADYVAKYIAKCGISPDFQKVLNVINKQKGIWTEEGWVFPGDADLMLLKLSRLPRISKVFGYFRCDNNQLTSLKGCPAKAEDFSCGSNLLTSLEGGPTEVPGYYFCDSNQLRTLKGAPKKVGGYFSCENNRLTSLEFVPIINPTATLFCENNYLPADELLKSAQKRGITNIFLDYQKDPSELPPFPEKEPQELQESQKEPLKSKENPYGSLHPSEIQWDSIDSTESRGFPVWNGAPKKTLEPVVSKPKEPKGLFIETCKTQGDLLGTKRSQEGQSKKLILRKDLSLKEKEHYNRVISELREASIVIHAVSLDL